MSKYQCPRCQYLDPSWPTTALKKVNDIVNDVTVHLFLLNKLILASSQVSAIARSCFQMQTGDEFLNFYLIKNWSPSKERITLKLVSLCDLSGDGVLLFSYDAI